MDFLKQVIHTVKDDDKDKTSGQQNDNPDLVDRGTSFHC